MAIRKVRVFTLLAAFLIPSLAVWGQALPGYERARVDQLRNEKNRRTMDVAGVDAESFTELSLETWKARAVTWADVRLDEDRLLITSASEHFEDLMWIRTRDDKAEPDRAGTALQVSGKRHDVWLQLPERAQASEVRCRLDVAEDGQLFGIFLTGDRRYICHTRASS